MNEILAANIAALGSRSEKAATAVRNSTRHPTLTIVNSRSGVPVPTMESGARQFTFHSRYSPVVEAERRCEQTGAAGFVVFLGLGAGYHIAPFLRSPEFETGLIIEYDARIVRSVLETIRLEPILGDTRLEFLIDPTRDELEAAVSRAFLPVVTERFSVVPLDGRVRFAHEEFARAAGTARAAAEAQIADFTVQRRLGLRWTANSLDNIADALERRGASAFLNRTTFASMWRGDSGSAPGRAAVVAAGPSLEYHFERIASADTVISTDTALPALLAAGLQPDTVVSVDAQIYSYHHLLCSRPTDIPWVLDLAASPSISRRVDSVFFVGPHPLSRLISAWFYPIFALPRPGGNVTQTAVSLASVAGADRIDVYGADFAYPDGKPYARGTYLYRYFESRADRYGPVESVVLGFARDADAAYRETGAPRLGYRTPSLDAYREELTAFAATLPARVTRYTDDGATIRPTRDATARVRRRSWTTTAEPPVRIGELWSAFLDRYHGALSSIPQPTAPLSRWFRSLDHDHAAAAATILPPLAANPTRSPDDVSEAIAWCLDRVARHRR